MKTYCLITVSKMICSQRAMTVGKLSRCHKYISLPDDFDFGTYAPEALMRGLGDRVASIAQPIALGIDVALGTDLANCEGCKKRQEALNEKFPSKPL